MAKECPKLHRSSQHINEVSTYPSILDPTTQMVLRDMLTLNPQARSQIINSLMMIGNDDIDLGSPSALHINNLTVPSPGPFTTLCSVSPASSSHSSTHTPLSSPPMSPCHSYRSGSGSPTLDPLTSEFLYALSLNDELPRASDLFRPFSISPALTDDDDDDDDVWYDAAAGSDDLWTPHAGPSSTAASRVEDDTHSRRGVKTSSTLVLQPSGSSRPPVLAPTPQYPSMFLCHTLERPLDPDMVQSVRNAMLQPHDELHRKVTKKPIEYSLHMQKKRKLREEPENEGPSKRPRKQLAKRTHPLPAASQKGKPSHANANPGPPAQTLPKLEDDGPQYDWVRQHIAFCYRPGAKEPTYPVNPFPADASSAVQGFRKRYRPIDMTKKT
ncbi:hypothetical protein EDB92DRAFT_1939693 [Lactarius akahatsu]|uniref:Uncharacterized protein n=1 Tax=Lactarius akahatsu TaxID=416441 RepID=A0AAD4LRQ3_9AGAM|nr:hypothetical protein EDB92DRAFT_1939693 [Lactarius akahatsu]